MVHFVSLRSLHLFQVASVGFFILSFVDATMKFHMNNVIGFGGHRKVKRTKEFNLIFIQRGRRYLSLLYH